MHASAPAAGRGRAAGAEGMEGPAGRPELARGSRRLGTPTPGLDAVPTGQAPRRDAATPPA